MAEPTLLASAAFAMLVAAVYAYVGFRVSRRNVSEDAALASWAFAVWWFSLAALTVAGGVQSLAAAIGYTSVAVATAFTFIALLVLCVALWGLLYYLVYLFTGRRRAWIPLAGFYLAAGAFLVWYILAQQPDGIVVNRWSVALHYAAPITGPVQAALVAIIILPQFLGALAYLTLYFKVSDRTLRYRIALVSLSILIWFGSAYAANVAGLSQNDSWQVVSRLIGLGAAFTILFAYQPPPFLRRRYGLRSVSEETTAAAPPEAPARGVDRRPDSSPAAGLAA